MTKFLKIALLLALVPGLATAKISKKSKDENIVIVPMGAANVASDVKEIVLTDDNSISLRTDFNDESVLKVMNDAEALDSRLPSGQPIYLVLYTPGGSIEAGLDLYRFLQGLNRPVHTVTIFAASMGFQTVQQLGQRYVTRNGVLMSHHAAGGISGTMGGADQGQLGSRYSFWLKRLLDLDNQTVKRTNGKQTLESYQKQYQPELWVEGQEAVDKGYADALVNVKCDSSLSGKTDQLNIQVFMFNINVIFSKCATKVSPLAFEVSLQTNKGEMKLTEFLQKNPNFEPCSKKTESSEYYYNSVRYSDENKTVEKQEVCAVDPKLTLETIQKALEEQKKLFKMNIRDRADLLQSKNK